LEQLQKNDKETETKINAQLKRLEEQEKQSNNFRKSYQKYCNNQQLSVVDIKTILTRFKERNNSPLKTRAAELRQQWDNQKHRLNNFCITPVDGNENNMLVAAASTVPRDPVLQNMEQIIFEPTGSAEINSSEIAEQINSTDVMVSHMN
jgi:hypothetical protein